MAFSPRATWSQGGYVGTTWRNDDKDDAPGSSEEKTTLILGNGYIFDRAELARIAANQNGEGALSSAARVVGTGNVPSGTKPTVMGEERARAAKKPIVAFDGRTPRRTPPAKPVPKPKTKFDAADGAGHHDGSSPGADQYWDHKTRGYTNTFHGWPHSSKPFVSKGVIDREPERLIDTAPKFGQQAKTDKQYYDANTRGFTNTGHGWPRSSRPHLSKGVIDREPERLIDTAPKFEKQVRSDSQYWDGVTRGFTNTGKGWPHSSRPHLSKGVIDREPELLT